MISRSMASPAYGPKDAPITIVEFSDYECPFCKQWHEQVWNQLEKKYGNQIRLVYRDFPLYGLHDNAAPAAEAAHCADEQGKYWPYHDMLFSGDYQLSRQSYEAIAVRLGLDSAKFAACLDAGTYKSCGPEQLRFRLQTGSPVHPDLLRQRHGPGGSPAFRGVRPPDPDGDQGRASQEVILSFAPQGSAGVLSA